MDNKLKLAFLATLLALSAAACSERSPLPEEGRLYYTTVEGGRSRIEWMDQNGGHVSYVVGALPERSRISSSGRRAYEKLKNKAEINSSPASSPSLSRNGRLMIYVCSEPNALRLINLETAEEEGLVKTSEPLYFPCLSRDNEGRFAYLRGDVTQDQQRIFVQQIGKPPICLVDAKRLGPPSWSNFGQDILFSYASSSGKSALYATDSAKADEETKVIMPGAVQACMAPTGSTIAAVVNGKIVLYDIFSKKSREIVHEADCSSPTWNPSGNILAFVKDNAIYTVEQTGDNLKRISPENKVVADVCWAKGF